MAALLVKMSPNVGTVYYNPVDNVTVTAEPTPVTDNAWVAEQLAKGHIVVVDSPLPPPVPEAQAEVEPEPQPE